MFKIDRLTTSFVEFSNENNHVGCLYNKDVDIKMLTDYFDKASEEYKQILSTWEGYKIIPEPIVFDEPDYDSMDFSELPAYLKIDKLVERVELLESENKELRSIIELASK